MVHLSMCGPFFFFQKSRLSQQIAHYPQARGLERQVQASFDGTCSGPRTVRGESETAKRTKLVDKAGLGNSYSQKVFATRVFDHSPGQRPIHQLPVSGLGGASAKSFIARCEDEEIGMYGAGCVLLGSES